MGSKIFPHIRTDARTDGRDCLGLKRLRRETKKLANSNERKFLFLTMQKANFIKKTYFFQKISTTSGKKMGKIKYW